MADSLEQSVFQFRQAIKPFIALTKLDEAVTALLGFVQREQELKTSIATLQAQKAQLDADIAQCQATHNTRVGALKAEQQKIAQEHEARLTALRTKYAAAEADMTQKTADAVSAAAEAASKKAALDKDYTTAVTTMKIKYKAEQEATKKAVQAEIDSIKKERDALVTELASLKGRIAAA